MRQLFATVVWRDKSKGVSRTGVTRLRFDKSLQLYVHPDIKAITIPGRGLFVYDRLKQQWRTQKLEDYDWENDLIVFCDADEEIVRLFEVAFAIGAGMSEYHQEHKSSILLP